MTKGEAMSEDVPQTLEEIAAALMAARNKSLAHCNYSDSFGAQAREVLRWREAWLRDAEPRLRPRDEMIPRGCIAAVHHSDGWRVWNACDSGIMPGVEWVMLEPPAKSVSIRDMAQALGELPAAKEDPWVDAMVLRKYAVEADRLRRAVLELP